MKCKALAFKLIQCFRNGGCGLKEKETDKKKLIRPFTVQFTSMERRSIAKRHSPKIRSNQWGLEATIHFKYSTAF